MYYPDPPSLPIFSPSADEADGLLAELYQAQAALRIAEYHLRLWRANSATGNMPFRAYRAYAAHEAMGEAGEIVDRISAQIRTEVSPVDAAHREFVSIVQRVDSGGVE